MNHSNMSNQEILAEEFAVYDTLINKASNEAVLKIKRWKFIGKIPGIGKRIRKEADRSIEKTLFSYVSNTYVLIEEGYYFDASAN